ncbi:MAG: type II toxin-antitoxin system VapC family toxin [Deltaproteobacteria bacterium]|nr:type II toxin-antitoxin system VapC family toxin [Deltaproteobacteria bacterium]
MVLLDTHALIWSIEDSARLSATARRVIVDGGNVVLASAASGWEIAIKKALGRLSAPDDLEEVIETVGFTRRTITFADARRVGLLPAHHQDPFDRMLVAQAIEDGVPIVSCDPQIALYDVQVIW